MSEFSLRNIESKESYKSQPFEVRQAISREYISQYGDDEVKKRFDDLQSSEMFSSMQPEEQEQVKTDYNSFYGIEPVKEPLEDVSLLTDVKDVGYSALKGASSITDMVGAVAGFLGFDEAKESLLDMSQVTSDYYSSKISKQGQAVEKQNFLSDEDGKWFGDNALKKAFMTAAGSAPATIVTAPIGGGASAVISKAKWLPKFIRAVKSGGKEASKASKYSHNLLAYATAEGGTSGLAASANAGKQIRDMSEEAIRKSPVYNEYLKTMSPEDARAELRGKVEEETFKSSAIATIVGSAISPGGAFPQIFSKTGKGFVRDTASGMVSEGLEEGGQSLLEGGAENLVTQRNLNPDQALWEGSAENVALGAVSGAIMGGPMAGVGSFGKTAAEMEQGVASVEADTDPEEIAKYIEQETETPQGVQFEGLMEEEQEVVNEMLTKINEAPMDVISGYQARMPNLMQDNPQVAKILEPALAKRSAFLLSQQAVDEQIETPQFLNEQIPIQQQEQLMPEEQVSQQPPMFEEQPLQQQNTTLDVPVGQQEQLVPEGQMPQEAPTTEQSPEDKQVVATEKSNALAEETRVAEKARIEKLREEVDIEHEKVLKEFDEKKVDPEIISQAKKEAKEIVTEHPAYQQMAEAKRMGGINIFTAKDHFSETTIKSLNKKYPALFQGGHLAATGQAPHVDEVASSFGFDTANEMIDSWISAPTIKSEVARISAEKVQEYEKYDAMQAEAESTNVTDDISEPVADKQKVTKSGIMYTKKIENDSGVYEAKPIDALEARNEALSQKEKYESLRDCLSI